MSADGREPGVRDRKVVAWDGPTRLFHWLLAILVALAWASHRWGDHALVWHTWNGYMILTRVVWRVLWGLVGSSTARFSSFIYGPATAARYAIDFLLRRPRYYLGHNPLGGLVVCGLLGLVGGQAILGLFSYDDHDALTGGPLSALVPDAVWSIATRLHHLMFDLLLAVIGLHVLANVLYLVWKRENLVGAMITGRKEPRAYEDQAEARLAGGGRALLCLLAAVAIVFGGITLAGGKIL